MIPLNEYDKQFIEQLDLVQYGVKMCEEQYWDIYIDCLHYVTKTYTGYPKKYQHQIIDQMVDKIRVKVARRNLDSLRGEEDGE